MVAALQKAQAVARKAQEALYSGTATVTERRKVRDEQTKLTKEQDVVALENQPCRLSFEPLRATQQTGAAASVTQVIRLFLAPEVTVKPGSRVTVTQDGVTACYRCSGVPAVYPTHQEILLDLAERWA